MDSDIEHMEEYGILETKGSDLVEIYKTYVITAEANISRRHASNRFYFSVIAAVFIALSFVANLEALAVKNWFMAAILLFSFITSISWFLTLTAARSLSSSKYEALHELERRLPIAPFSVEWKHHKAARRDRIHFTLIELILPVAIGTLSIVGLVLLAFGVVSI